MVKNPVIRHADQQGKFVTLAMSLGSDRQRMPEKEKDICLHLMEYVSRQPIELYENRTIKVEHLAKLFTDCRTPSNDPEIEKLRTADRMYFGLFDHVMDLEKPMALYKELAQTNPEAKAMVVARIHGTIMRDIILNKQFNLKDCKYVFETCLAEINRGNICPTYFYVLFTFPTISSLEPVLWELHDQVKRAYYRLQPFFPLRFKFGDLSIVTCVYSACRSHLYRDYAIEYQYHDTLIYCSYECLIRNWIQITSDPRVLLRIKFSDDATLSPEDPAVQLDYIELDNLGRLIDFFELSSRLPFQQDVWDMHVQRKEHSEAFSMLEQSMEKVMNTFVSTGRFHGDNNSTVTIFHRVAVAVRMLWCRAAICLIGLQLDPSSEILYERGVSHCFFLLGSVVLSGIDEASANETRLHVTAIRRHLYETKTLPEEPQHQLESQSNNPDRSKKSKKKKSKKNKSKEAANFSVDVAFGRDLVGKECALNAALPEDGCPVCLKEWNTFEQTDLAIVLPCLHAVCAPCLSRYRAECRKSFETDLGEYSTSFTCSICRERIRSNILYQAAQVILAENLVESIPEFKKALLLPKKVEAD